MILVVFLVYLSFSKTGQFCLSSIFMESEFPVRRRFGLSFQRLREVGAGWEAGKTGVVLGDPEKAGCPEASPVSGLVLQAQRAQALLAEGLRQSD